MPDLPPLACRRAAPVAWRCPVRALGVVIAAGTLHAQPPVPTRTAQPSGTTALLQAVHAVDARTVWVSGHRNTALLTTDGGASWRRIPTGDDSTRQWRDVHATTADSAWLLAIGNGPASRIVQTTDGGRHWRDAFVNDDQGAFYDCLAFWSPREGFAYSDASDGRNPVALTRDGTHWSVARELLPPPQGSEGGFAASGGCTITLGARHAWIATGAGRVPRVHRSTTAGRSWASAELPLVAGEGAGATAIAMRDTLTGVVVGGAIGGTATGPRVARTTDGGATWRVGGEVPFAGAIYGVTYARTPGAWIAIAVGPRGAAWSADDGATWTALDEVGYWSVGCAGASCWLAGPQGRITRVDWR
jgi:photosystem II stability/assembly factor-like uncharacterized protein